MEPKHGDSLGSDVAQDLVGLLGPVGSSLGKRIYRAVAAEWQRNRSTALRAAEAASGLTREQFVEWAEQEPRAVPLYLEVLWAAGMNGHDETLPAMGTVLGSAAGATATGNEEEVERAELALRAMDDLTPQHFRVLAAAGADLLTVGEDDPPGIPGVAPDAVKQCLVNLVGAGLVGTQLVWAGTQYPLTDLGRAVVRAAEAYSKP